MELQEMNKQQFYLTPEKGHDCIKLPKKDSEYLLKDNFLNEFYTEKDKQQVLSNLGILLRLEELKNLIDQKVIEAGGIPYDEVPTEDSQNLLTSSSIYNALLNYYDKDTIDRAIQNIFNTYQIDNRLDKESENAIQNGVVATALDILYREIQQQASNIRGVDNKLDLSTEEIHNILNSIITQLQNKINREELSQYQKVLTSGVNIKTINGVPLLGPGNINIIQDIEGVPLSSIQPDWNQTDDSARNYIQNKPDFATDDDIVAIFDRIKNKE